MTQERGVFILLEGLDRSGKSTQCLLLMDALRERKIAVRAMHFPVRTTTIGQMIDAHLSNNSSDALSDEAVHLLFSANRWECKHDIEETLAQGTSIVMDRYL